VDAGDGGDAPEGGGGDAAPAPDAGDGGDVVEGGAPVRHRWLAYAAYGGDPQPLYIVHTSGVAEPVQLAPNLSGFTPPAWRADGRQLLYVEYFCCGASNGAYVVDVDGDTLGAPRLIHPPRGSGETVREAAYSPDGRYLIAQFVGADLVGRWYSRRIDEAVDAWVPFTAGASWNPSQQRPAWSGDGSAALVYEGSGGQQRVYLLELAGSAAAARLVHTTGPDEQDVYRSAFGPGSQDYVFFGGGALMWGQRVGTAPAAPLTSATEFSPYFPAEYSPSGAELLFTAADSADSDSASTSLFVKGLAPGAPAAELLWPPAPLAFARSIFGATWLPSGDVAFIGDAETDDVLEAFTLSRSGALTKVSGTLADGATAGSLDVIRGGLLVSVMESDGATQNVRLAALGGASQPEALTTFAFESYGYASVAGGPSPSGDGAFVTSQGYDVDEGTAVGSELFYVSLGGSSVASRVSVVSPMAAGRYISSPFTWSADGALFAYSGDFDGDEFQDVAVTEMVDGRPGAPRLLGSLLDVIGSSPGAFVWQP